MFSRQDDVALGPTHRGNTCSPMPVPPGERKGYAYLLPE